jgi:hypothetical protein
MLLLLLLLLLMMSRRCDILQHQHHGCDRRKPREIGRQGLSHLYHSADLSQTLQLVSVS